ncbi:MAG: serine/threonine protein kinase, partial [Actinobacteria bacterium]|nr:serine/threonine protein kinase [Actinomycetota bacterium]
LDHPHIVPILSFGEEGGRLYLAMAYVEGSDLRELLRRDGPAEPVRTFDLIAQVADALDAAHAAGLVHRDVKPANILVADTADGEHAYVCDFGLARHVSSVSSLTGDRGFVGTLDYVPPEQIAGRQIDGRADVYSLGCVLYECLTGERPFTRESELALVYAHLNDAPPLLTDLRPELPEGLNGAIATALAKEPDARYASCGELVTAARAALAGKPYARRSRRRRRAVVALVALLAATTAGIAGYLTTREQPATVTGASPAISQTSIGGAVLGRRETAYQRQFGGYKEFELTESDPPIPGLSFGQPALAVYFRESPGRADVITTWNRNLRTAAGIGPCSTIEQMQKAYGKDVRPSPHGTSPDGKTVFSYVVGRNLLFATQDQRTIGVVALYKGLPNNQLQKNGGPQSWANFIAALETPCL